jgi:hypothetical protein
MPFKLTESSHPQIIEIEYTGAVTPDELIAAFEVLAKEAQVRNSYKILADCSHLEGGHSILNLYYLIDLIEKAGIPHTMMEAIIQPQLTATQEEVRFYETACLNRGYNVRIFANREAALEWLIK